MSARQAAKEYYDSFSLTVGLRDWALPNARHRRLRRALANALPSNDGLRIFDLGCGAGVMSGHLTGFGTVVGVDLSQPAVELARTLVPNAEFYDDRLESLPELGPFDVVTLFDVLEHIPRSEWAQLFAHLAERLAPRGTLFMSTPRPEYTRWMLSERPDLVQVIEEAVSLDDVRSELEPLGFELHTYETYDIEHTAQYHAMSFVLAPASAGVASPPQPTSGLAPMARASRILRRIPLSWRLLRARRPRTALQLFTARTPPVRPSSASPAASEQEET